MVTLVTLEIQNKPKREELNTLKISYKTIFSNLRLTVGFGYAGFNIVTALQKLGHSVPFDDEDCPIQLCFDHPDRFSFHDHQYKIGYSPWESTGMRPGWV